MKSSYSPEQIAILFQECPMRWWIAGGWAIDLFLGKQTREHEDVDVAILRSDEHAFREHLASWELWLGLGDGELEDRPITIDEELPANREVLWCRTSTDSDWAFELLLNGTINENWVFKRDGNIQKPLQSLGYVTKDGIPYLRPEIVLLFKAKNNREKDMHDLEQALPRLDSEARVWLSTSLQTAHPGHPWLEGLS